MLGLLLLVVIYIVLGFMYAWITGIVAREEIEVKTGVFVVLLPGVVGIGLAIAGVDVGLLALPLDFVLLVLGGKFLAGLEWKHSSIIAAVYTVLLFLVGLGLVLLLGGASSA